MTEKTCKDCKAFLAEENEDSDGDGVCILNPPQMFISKDETGQENIISMFPQVNGSISRCMQLILKMGLVLFFLIFFCSCATTGEIFKGAFQQMSYRNSPEYYKDRIICRTYKDAYQRIVTKCN